MPSEKFCKGCHGYMDAGRAQYCSPDCRDEHKKQRQGTIEARHTTLRRILEQERIPKSDPLWNEHYLAALLEPGRCIYCDGLMADISRSGHTLDRIDNDKGHIAANVIGPVCRDCNGIRRDILTVTEMFYLAPRLREIRRRREISKRFFYGKEVTSVEVTSQEPPVVSVKLIGGVEKQILGVSAAQIIRERCNEEV